MSVTVEEKTKLENKLKDLKEELDLAEYFLRCEEYRAGSASQKRRANSLKSQITKIEKRLGIYVEPEAPLWLRNLIREEEEKKALRALRNENAPATTTEAYSGNKI